MTTLRVLLVDDDEAESDRITGCLEKASHAVMATRGLTEAAEALEMQRFDAVMLTSRLINEELSTFRDNLTRLEKSGRASARIPVVCYASSSAQEPEIAELVDLNVDACLPEQFDANSFSELVQNLANLSRAKGPGESLRSPDQALPIFRSEELQEQVGFDAELVSELLNLFLVDSEEQVKSMNEALQAGDLRTLSRVAHSIKGSLGSLYAVQAASRAEALEQISKTSDATAAGAALAHLEDALEVLKPELLKLLNAGSGS